jgi:hypothetical protein
MEMPVVIGAWVDHVMTVELHDATVDKPTEQLVANFLEMHRTDKLADVMLLNPPTWHQDSHPLLTTQSPSRRPTTLVTHNELDVEVVGWLAKPAEQGSTTVYISSLGLGAGDQVMIAQAPAMYEVDSLCSGNK